MQGEWACSSSFEGIIFALASRAAVGSGFPSTVHRSMGVLVLVALPPAAVKSFRFSVFGFGFVLERVFVLVLEALRRKRSSLDHRLPAFRRFPILATRPPGLDEGGSRRSHASLFHIVTQPAENLWPAFVCFASCWGQTGVG
jgi:hypothetical protein